MECGQFPLQKLPKPPAHDIKFFLRRSLFEKEQHLGECSLTGRSATTFSASLPGLTVNNFRRKKHET